MSDEGLSIETEEQRERRHAARRQGGMCAACGRALGAGDAVYIERFRIVGTFGYAPVGQECATSELLMRTAGVELERCVGCGRGVYYGTPGAARTRPLCSQRCAYRHRRARHTAQAKAEG